MSGLPLPPLRLFASLIIALVISSCKDDSNPVTKTDDIVFPDTLISYNRHVQPLFNIACATANCHDIATRANNLDLSSYQGIRQRFYDVVLPRNPDNSRLLWNIMGKPGSMPMPPYYRLNDNHVNGLRQWILEGATGSFP